MVSKKLTVTSVEDSFLNIINIKITDKNIKNLFNIDWLIADLSNWFCLYICI